MQTSTNNTESKTDSTDNNQTTEKVDTGYASPEEKPQETPAEPEQKVDDYGYDTPAEPEETPAEPKETPAEPEEKKDDKVEKPATGYGDKKEETPAEPEEKKDDPEEKKEEETDPEKEISEVVKELPDHFDKDKVSKFALENKLNKDQVKAYVEFAKNEEVEIAKSQQEAIKKQRSEWKQQLTDDPEFGGEAFDQNVHRVEKLLEKHLPETKKVLTERGSMLPPYIMKDFLALDKVLNPKTSLVNGEPGTPKENEDGDFLDIMYK